MATRYVLLWVAVDAAGEIVEECQIESDAATLTQKIDIWTNDKGDTIEQEEGLAVRANVPAVRNKLPKLAAPAVKWIFFGGGIGGDALRVSLGKKNLKRTEIDAPPIIVLG